jgi:acyl-CoA dehydrogenase/citronellyl-CoA dehydrogenase
MIAGEHVVAIAVTEPGAGSDVAGIRSRAERVDGGYRLRGTKMFITNAGFAETMIVAAKTDPDAGHQGITTFILERGEPGMTFSEPLAKMGWHSSDTREVVLDDVFVPDDRVLGELGRGFHQIMHAFERERVLLAAMGVGLADVVLEEAMTYARERTAFGQPISRFQSVGHPLVAMASEVAAARLLALQAAERFDTDHPDASTSAAMAKLIGARVANRAADVAVQALGGAGYVEETPVAMHYRDARILRIGGGSDEVQMEILVKRLGL